MLGKLDKKVAGFNVCEKISPADGIAVGRLLGAELGTNDGRSLGKIDGADDCTKVGAKEGGRVGLLLGVSEGKLDGNEVGTEEGSKLGVSLGISEGKVVGIKVGVEEGSKVGISVGLFEGRLVDGLFEEGELGRGKGLGLGGIRDGASEGEGVLIRKGAEVGSIVGARVRMFVGKEGNLVGCTGEGA